MHRSLLLLIAILVITAPSLAQSNATESQTLQSMLEELRLLRQDLRTIAVVNQRGQILLHRVQLQQVVVNSATQRLEERRAKLADAQLEKQGFESVIKRDEEELKDAQDPGKRDELETVIRQSKTSLEMFTAQEQELQPAVQQAEEQLRTEQMKLDELEAQLEKADKILENLYQAQANTLPK